MTAIQLFDALGDLPDEIIQEAEEKKKPRAGLGIALVLAACAAIAALLFLPRNAAAPANAITLSARSEGVTAAYLDTLPENLPMSSAACLADYPEEELLSGFETVIFRGQVADIQNVVLNFGGEVLYWSLAELRVERVIRGDLSAGETVRVLMQIPFVEGQSVSAADTLYQMRLGMEGVFMPRLYDSDDAYPYGGSTLYLSDLAPYGFPDGVRFAFLQTGDGLVFARGAYPSLAGAQTLDELETALRDRLSASEG